MEILDILVFCLVKVFVELSSVVWVSKCFGTDDWVVEVLDILVVYLVKVIGEPSFVAWVSKCFESDGSLRLKI